ncbi:MAG: GTP cyclohydrolase I FolE [Candidatus Omnitrophica bacterium]|nr:GTP cyclohydrolase I FolE [Candidatus Omnitrophota bacterium]MBU4477663.1 GTP cyclohydrolase I FolE [Candidatus Omnitrophota bacterium]MCG2703154.1 GTP cyclohydrolase I FolE [Candidatus Omnitrophota bacterium]
MNNNKVKKLIRQLLIEIGENPDREGLKKTPERVLRSLQFLTQGYNEKPRSIINNAVFKAEANNMIIVRDIEIYSLCEHHLLPFFGRCHIGYIPTKKVLGVSKICRLVNVFSRRLQIQERLTSQLAQEIMGAINAEGVGVVIECRHLCKMMRGVEKQNSIMTTSSVLGSFLEQPATRAEFLTLLNRNI